MHTLESWLLPRGRQLDPRTDQRAGDGAAKRPKVLPGPLQIDDSLGNCPGGSGALFPSGAHPLHTCGAGGSQHGDLEHRI